MRLMMRRHEHGRCCARCPSYRILLVLLSHPSRRCCCMGLRDLLIAGARVRVLRMHGPPRGLCCMPPNARACGKLGADHLLICCKIIIKIRCRPQGIDGAQSAFRA